MWSTTRWSCLPELRPRPSLESGGASGAACSGASSVARRLGLCPPRVAMSSDSRPTCSHACVSRRRAPTDGSSACALRKCDSASAYMSRRESTVPWFMCMSASCAHMSAPSPPPPSAASSRAFAAWTKARLASRRSSAEDDARAYIARCALPRPHHVRADVASSRTLSRANCTLSCSSDSPLAPAGRPIIRSSIERWHSVAAVRPCSSAPRKV
mmetsp:Transcript_29573/g.81207  ORF Transcript_29573/g.81207 Transcript_29573/m.81207 type:complete len:213 (-) Transcript_29573:147-785(-)